MVLLVTSKPEPPPPSDACAPGTQLLTRISLGILKILLDLGASIVNRRAAEQLLHGEPHPWNVLDTKNGPLFMDFEDSVHGPVEFDLAWVPKEVSERYPDADQDLVGECRGLVLAIIATHRWVRDDQHPSGRQSGVAFLNALREGPPWRPLNTV